MMILAMNLLGMLILLNPALAQLTKKAESLEAMHMMWWNITFEFDVRLIQTDKFTRWLTQNQGQIVWNDKTKTFELPGNAVNK